MGLTPPLDAGSLTGALDPLLSNTLALPPLTAIISLCALLLHSVTHPVNSRAHISPLTQPSSPLDSLSNYHHGRKIATLVLLRLAGCFILVSMSCIQYVHTLSQGQHSGKPEVLHDPELWMTATYLYATILSAIIFWSPSWSPVVSWYNTLVLCVTVAVYAYRDIWPLATYTESPVDDVNDTFLWVKLFILVMCAIAIPILTPRRYVLQDPKGSPRALNLEQHCSWLDRMFYGYITPVIDLSKRMSHVPVEDMPPLLDSDKLDTLRKHAFRHLDPFSGAKRRHIFFGLMRVFWREYVVMCASLAITAFTTFCSPTGIYRLLDYLEKGPGHDTIRPWFWIFFISAGSLITIVAFQNYIYYAMRLQVHMEALLTQLIFEHSLRIRVTANESSGGAVTDGNPSPAAAEGTSTGNSNQASLVARVSNLITTHLATIGAAKEFSFLLVEVPIQTTLAVVFLYRVLGVSALVGVAVAAILLPLPKYIGGLLHRFQRQRTNLMDARVQQVTEALNVVRMIKMFGWEKKVLEQINLARESELAALLKFKILMSWNRMINNLIPTVTMIATYATYTIVMKETLTASTIFSTLTVFDILRVQFMNISTFSTRAIQGKVSLDRVDEFLKNTELLDVYSLTLMAHDSVPGGDVPAVSLDAIGFRDASFAWSSGKRATVATGSSRSFILRVPGTVKFQRNAINLITGPTGSGETSVLMALLGEMHFMPSTPESWFKLDRRHGVAYAAQESWVQNRTIKDNILFGEPYDEQRYRKVIYQCALDKDLELFDAGDLTEVGEKGITLSGGQKARVTLARAVYSAATVLLLDDVFAALDVHTALSVVDRCLGGDLVTERTVIIVTHNISLVAPLAKCLVEVTIDGVVRESSISTSFLSAAGPATSSPQITRDEPQPDTKVKTAKDGKLVLAEELVEGRVTWNSFMLFLRAHAGSYPFLYTALWTSFFIFSQIMSASKNWFLGFWGSQYEQHPSSEVSAALYLSVYAAIVIIGYSLSETAYFLFMYGSIRASRTINAVLMGSIFTSAFRWLDVTPVARIISRCTQDVGTIDDPLPEALAIVFSLTVSLIAKLGAVTIFTPLFLLPGLALGALGFYLGSLFIKAQLSVKREMSNAKSPLISHVIGAISATVSIRAFGAEDRFIVDAASHIDHFTRINRTRGSLERWIATRIDILGNLYFAALACYLVYGSQVSASNSGFSLNMAADFSMLVLVWVRFFNDFEVQANSLERVQGFINIEHEPQQLQFDVPPAAWPTSGGLQVRNLSAGYSKMGPNVLHNISFDVKSGERLGIVGRTGSGKSSLSLALLRCILTEGDIVLDGQNLQNLSLDALRSNITIIPQAPELMKGSLRKNLDPFGEVDDPMLNHALRDAGLFSLQSERGEGNLTLDSEIATGGANLSVGERQIVALARALIRRSKILIFDEATSAIDHETDSIIQNSLQRTLPPDVTVITIAHRLQTIMHSDRVMVLDGGRIVEHDAPLTLLAKDRSAFKDLVDASQDAATLYQTASTKSREVQFMA